MTKRPNSSPGGYLDPIGDTVLPAEPENLVGSQIGNYQVSSLLGEGGMGRVYLGEHPQIGRQVAIKVLDPVLSSQPEIVQRFITEARILAKIDHPNIIDIYDFGRTNAGQLYYIMELLKGHELVEVLNEKGQMTPVEVVPFLEQICAALQSAHDHGIIHRDLKPENIYVLDHKPLAIKILDFGIAKLLQAENKTALTSTGMVMGTPLYISPEQAAGQPERICIRTDLYSLGVLLYRMLAGHTPFVDRTPALLLAKHIQDTPPSILEHVPSLHPQIAQLIGQCLEKDPDKRPASALEIAESFVTAVGPVSYVSLVSPARSTSRVATPQVEKQPTTLTTASGEKAEVVDELLPRSSRAKWIAVGGLGMMIGAIALALIFRQPDRGPELVQTPPTTAAKQPSAHPQDKAMPDRKAAEPTLHTIKAVGAAAPALCRLLIKGIETRQRPMPCTFQVKPGAHVELTVERRGYLPFSLAWSVNRDREIVVNLQQKPPIKERKKRAIVRDRSPKVIITKKPVEPVQPKVSKPQPPSTKPKLSTPKPKPKPRSRSKRLGEGTVEF